MAGGSELMSYSHACAHISDGLILGAREQEKKKESQSLTSKHGGAEEPPIAQVGFTKRCHPGGTDAPSE